MPQNVPTREPLTREAKAPEERDRPAASPSPDLELDTRGLNCPLPILKAKKAISGLEKGQILKVVSTDPGAVPDFAAFSRRTKHEIVEQSEGGGEYTFYLRKV